MTIDILELTDNNDTHPGQAGPELILALGGNDITINGADGNDSINGGAGYDNLQGGDGDDMIETGMTTGVGQTAGGGAGDDILRLADGRTNWTGGDGEDLYVIAESAVTFTSPHLITDFTVGEDRLSFRHDASLTPSSVEVVEVLGDVMFRWNAMDNVNYGMSVRLQGVSYDAFEDNLDALADFVLDNRPDGGRKINGSASADDLNGSAKGDVIKGKFGRDTIDGGNGDDRIEGNWGRDNLDGGAGNDRVGGGLGRDKLYGGEGDDRLEGNAGRDTLDGGADNDILIGGAGKDTFRFNENSHFGIDDIMDFNPNTDVIDINGMGRNVYDKIEIEDWGDDAIILVGDAGTIIVHEVSKDDLTSDLFI